ncbi:hypothetical protein PC129_g3542 [Phytophthora cactorum]|uniref:DDE Tnp4 domain-containing protein n=2 Tax=Phytophthora cactorum TaxID=29920 RepID=A0A329RF99_9STRA|nr:hypothetical protein PC118_g20388 [Phytophthora cactorum]KAG3225845.1 hypothetical protein PC129_g3542 [Phytophthora cactorum]KAG4228153.1 hypothetical protein PC116_g23486 [Phytophthora cactorum]RAW23423.1 hypothetical protein PC110_g20140 [Phytophthora cactorum]
MARSSVSLGRVISRAAIAARASPPSLFKQSLTIRSGSNNDLSQWDKSRVWKQLSGFLPPGKHLTADTGYKIWDHMLTPFPEAEALQDSRKRLYNYLHPKTRIVVECAFGRLKDRFRILLGKLEQKSAGHVCKVVIGFVVLHNLFLLVQDEMEILGVGLLIGDAPVSVAEDPRENEHVICHDRQARYYSNILMMRD